MDRKTLLFDIDGTLILTGGAGRRAMNLAFAELFLIENGLDGVDMAGRIDVAILRAALLRTGLPTAGFDDQVRRFRDAYCRHLAVTLKQTRGTALPGVQELLTALKGRPHVRLGLVTGNFRSGAEMKLTHYGLWDFFSGGAFGDDCEDRGELVARAIESMQDGSRPDGGAVYVIGDTAYDIRAAKANSALAVAVGTGLTIVEELLAAGPDIFFQDFSDTHAVLAALCLAQ